MGTTKVKIFKDSVHGYINVPILYVKYLIDNKYFQRLRNIEQTGMRVLYPAAKHDRFSHSLGVFHLGQKAIDALYKYSNDDIFEPTEFKRCKILFLTACLLHDIGHTPFSHSLEEQIFANTVFTQQQRGRRPENVIKKSIDEYLKEIILEKEAGYCTSQGIKQISAINVKAAPHEQLGSYLIFDKLAESIKDLEIQFNIWEDDNVS